MKRKNQIKHKINQRTANRKNARARRRHDFRVAAKGVHSRPFREAMPPIPQALLDQLTEAAEKTPPLDAAEPQTEGSSETEMIPKPADASKDD